jgi:signal transduction histidine kinase
MQAKLRQEGFTLEIVQEEISPFRYDREAMIQVLINLIENSIKFCRSAHKKEITIRIYQEPKHIKIAVSDHGPGIPRHALKKVSGPKNPRYRHRSGSGQKIYQVNRRGRHGRE